MFLARRFTSPDKYSLGFTYSLSFFVCTAAIFRALSTFMLFFYLLRVFVIHLCPVKLASALAAEVILVSVLVMEIFSTPTDWTVWSYALSATYW